MREAVAVLGVLAGAGVAAWAWRRTTLRRQTLLRLGEPERPAAPPEPAPAVDTPFALRRRWPAWLAALATALALGLLARIGWTFSLTVGLIVLLLGLRLDAWRVERRRLLIEAQLADAIDLMIGTLRAGGSVLAALEAAQREAREPLRGQLDEVAGRIRLGDYPLAAIRGLEVRVPLETFRLFCAALAVHWEVGGSLEPLLAGVGRTVRDRIDLTRRLRSLTTQSRLSTVVILLTTWFIAAVLWRNDPQRMEEFVRSDIGQLMLAAALLLQAVGIVWSSALSKLRY